MKLTNRTTLTVVLALSATSLAYSQGPPGSMGGPPSPRSNEPFRIILAQPFATLVWPPKVPVGVTQQFAALVYGERTEEVQWALNGPACAKGKCGEISKLGCYKAPAEAPDPPDVTVTAIQNQPPFEVVSTHITVVSGLTTPGPDEPIVMTGDLGSDYHSPHDIFCTKEAGSELLPKSDDEEQAIADRLLTQIRAIAEEFDPILEATLYHPGQGRLDALEAERPKQKQAEDLVQQLNVLTGDPSTRAKVYVFVHPEIFGHFNFLVMEGLTVARNRRLAVSELEAALTDPSTCCPGMIAGEISRLRLLDKVNQAEIDREQLQYAQEIAQTLPARTDWNLAGAAADVFFALKRHEQTDTPEFAAAREILITHFGDLPTEIVQALLNADWTYLHDARIEPGLIKILQRCPDVPFCRGVRAAAQKRLREITTGQ